ncbi:CES2 [Branchiostoma lanceolatum]|uniref:CES2 protein n=1 Tax=Branchiostoma lanceolatum TaxID=7740 RepID=A0A8K0A460_BRALA|nr:CES2 [Branchiostoma lanceolatum]
MWNPVKHAAVVSTTHGDVRGSEFLTASVVGNAVFDRVFTFKGIPYAAPPVGDLRWRPPQDPGSWTGIRDVTEFGSRCPQDEFPLPHPIYDEVLGSRSNTSSSEDCLFLNVYTPNVSATANLPVMVWIHGGGWYLGSGETYPAEVPTSLHNVVMVTINYRLGNLGFLPTGDDDAPGNFGLLDAIKALEWVRSNIRNFGGDPDRVTIFGESAGGWAVSLLVMSPMATGLFHRAISQSGVAGVAVTPKGDLTRMETLARGLNCTTASYDDMMSCLRGLPSEDFTTPVLSSVVIDGRFLLQSPWDLMNHKFINRVDYLLGTNNDEFGFQLASEFPYVDADGMTRAEFETYLLNNLQQIAGQYLGGSGSAILQPVLDYVYLDPVMADDPIYLRNQFLNILMDAWFTAPTVMMAKAESGMPAVAWEAPRSRVYQYELQHSASVFSFRPPYVGVDHGDDLFLVFGIPLLRDEKGSYWKYSFTQEERDLSLDMMAYWVNFATNGDPNDSTGAARMRNMVHWPRYTSSAQSYLKLDVTSSADVKLRESRMKFWNEEMPRLLGKHVHNHRARAGFNAGTHGASHAAVVSTTHGDVRGSEFLTASVVGNAVFDRVFTFKGIPYAAPPVGDLRWRPPQDPGSWTGVRDVTEFGSRCPQFEFPLPDPLPHPIYDEVLPFRSNSSSEDCLFLNVFTPNVSATANLPVMVWIHGGGWSFGSGDLYKAEIPTSLHNVVMVTINYRLGNLGFLPTRADDAPGNFGLLDAIKALEWVRGNIRNFGGDPDRVTIFGQSAGGWAVSLLVMSPMATGLFHRAISQSGVAGVPVTQRGDLTQTQTLAAGLNCSTASYDD